MAWRVGLGPPLSATAARSGLSTKSPCACFLFPETFQKMLKLVKFIGNYLFIRKMCLTYQIAQKNVLYILVSKACIVNQLSTLLILEEQDEPFIHMRGLWITNPLCIPTPI
jgi:hypothetical protein